MKGGYDRSELRPLDENGNIILDPNDEFEGQFEQDDVVGNHTGAYAANNVFNPKPDCKYYHGNAVLGRARIRALIQAGAEIVKEGDQESLGDMSDLVGEGSQIDSAKGHRETILLRWPLEKYRKFKQAQVDYNQRLLESQTSGEDFLGRDNYSGSRYAQNKEVYRRETEHGMTFGERLDD